MIKISNKNITTSFVERMDLQQTPYENRLLSSPAFFFSGKPVIADCYR
jgi:hypothetical protein